MYHIINAYYNITYLYTSFGIKDTFHITIKPKLYFRIKYKVNRYDIRVEKSYSADYRVN